MKISDVRKMGREFVIAGTCLSEDTYLLDPIEDKDSYDKCIDKLIMNIGDSYFYSGDWNLDGDLTYFIHNDNTYLTIERYDVYEEEPDYSADTCGARLSDDILNDIIRFFKEYEDYDHFEFVVLDGPHKIS